MEPEPEQRPSEEGMGTEAFSTNVQHHMVLQATDQEGREPSVLRGTRSCSLICMGGRESVVGSDPYGSAAVIRRREYAGRVCAGDGAGWRGLDGGGVSPQCSSLPLREGGSGVHGTRSRSLVACDATRCARL